MKTLFLWSTEDLIQNVGVPLVCFMFLILFGFFLCGHIQGAFEHAVCKPKVYIPVMGTVLIDYGHH